MLNLGLLIRWKPNVNYSGAPIILNFD